MTAARSVRDAVASNPLWYHTIELAPGVTTPGWFDLRSVVDQLPWPDLAGKRCLDIGTFDGFLAFEMERRGAAEVVATDVPTHAEWDHLPRQRQQAIEFWERHGGEKGAGFRIAAEVLGSKVRREWINIYDLSPERIGTFDVVVCGTLLLHLRAPFLALEAIASVCKGHFLSSEQVDPWLSLVSRRRPAFYLEGVEGRWTIPNVAAHVHMLDMAGFDVLRRTRYGVPFGPGHPPRPAGMRDMPRMLRNRAIAGATDVVPHSGVLTRNALA